MFPQLGQSAGGEIPTNSSLSWQNLLQPNHSQAPISLLNWSIISTTKTPR
jgi:hypothetical protein